MDAKNTVSISPEYLRELMEAKRSLEGVRQERELERESWERLYSRRESGCYFIIRTLDGHLCYVPQGSNNKISAQLNPATGRRVLHCAGRSPCRAFDHDVDIELLPTRILRTYVEVEEHIMGVPIFDEVHPEDEP